MDALGCLFDITVCPWSRFYVARTVHAYPLCGGTIQQAIHAYSPIQPEYSHTSYTHRPAARVRWLYGIHPYSSYTIHAYIPYTIQPHTRPLRLLVVVEHYA